MAHQPGTACPQVDEDKQTVTVAAGITQRALLDYLSGGKHSTVGMPRCTPVPGYPQMKAL